MREVFFDTNVYRQLVFNRPLPKAKEKINYIVHQERIKSISSYLHIFVLTETVISSC